MFNDNNKSIGIFALYRTGALRSVSYYDEAGRMTNMNRSVRPSIYTLLKTKQKSTRNGAEFFPIFFFERKGHVPHRQFITE